MSEIKINGRIKVKSFYSSFLKQYPYLYPELKYPDGKPADKESTIANARGISKGGKYSPTDEIDFSINGNLTIANFEKRFENEVGIRCEVYYRKSRWVKASDAFEKLSLSAASERLKNEGAEIIKL
jgi:hypothetical protein